MITEETIISTIPTETIVYHRNTKGTAPLCFSEMPSILLKNIMPGDKEETFIVTMQKGKYDMEARLYEAENHVYPAYYIYIEKAK